MKLQSVVSAACDPDTITILRPRSFNASSLKLGKKALGGKRSKIEQNDEGSTVEVVLDESDSEKYCLTDELALKLGKIAVDIENVSGDFKPVDIEWALDQVNLLAVYMYNWLKINA